MNKQALIDFTKKMVTSSDGVYFLIEPKYFLKALLVEDCVDLDLFRPHESARITNTRWWKDRLVVMTENRLKLHQDMKVVLMKDPDRDKNLDGFLFDGFLFNNISTQKVQWLRGILNEDKRGLFKSNKELVAKRKAVVQPYYVRLLKLENDDEDKGVFILRNFY